MSWEVKKGDRVGLVGWNGAGKTTQLKIITGEIEPDKGEVIRVKNNMNIAYLTQEFDLVMTRTVREEFLSAFGDSLQIMNRLEEVQKELEKATDDMDRMVRERDEAPLASLACRCGRRPPAPRPHWRDSISPTFCLHDDVSVRKPLHFPVFVCHELPTSCVLLC